MTLKPVLQKWQLSKEGELQWETQRFRILAAECQMVQGLLMLFRGWCQQRWQQRQIVMWLRKWTVISPFSREPRSLQIGTSASYWTTLQHATCLGTSCCLWIYSPRRLSLPLTVQLEPPMPTPLGTFQTSQIQFRSVRVGLQISCHLQMFGWQDATSYIWQECGCICG